VTIKCPKCRFENPDDTNFCGKCATPLPGALGKTHEALTKTIGEISRDIAKGTLIGAKYRILAKLGAGGMGEVYRAEDLNLNRQVAIKVLPDIFAGDPERLARFQREAKVLAALNHPNIAAIHGVEEADGKRFLILELVEGESLKTRLDRGNLAIEDSLEVCRQIAEGLEGAHEKSIIHRDLKPGNIMVTSDGKIKILDFGLAKAFSAETTAMDIISSPTITADMTKPGILLGTAAYMSPEQARSRAVDKKTDIWAFGCILFECLSGRRAFEGETITETLATILKGDPPWDLLPENTPSRVKELLRRCLRKDPSERLHDVADARIEIADVIAQPQISELHLARPAHRGLFIAALIVTLLIVAIGASFLTWKLKTVASQPIVRTAIDISEGMQLTRGTMGPAFPEVALSHDGKFLVYSASLNGSVEKAMLYRRSLDRNEATPIPGTEGGRYPIFSQDGQWLVFSAQGSLKKLATVGGGIPSTICACPDTPMGITWGSDRRIVIGTSMHGLQIVDADGGKLKSITTPDPAKEASHVLPYFLPGGKALLFTAKPHMWGTRSNIELFSINTGQRKALIENGADARYVPTGHVVFLREGTLMAVRFDPKNMEVRSPAVPVIVGVLQSLNVLTDIQNSGCGLYSISDCGSLVYVPGGIYPDLKTHLSWVDHHGKTDPVKPLDGKPIVSVRLSPDDKYLAYRTVGKNADVWVYDLSRGVSRKLTREGRAMHLTWTPDGSRITFAYSLAGVSSIFWMPADGTGSPEELISSKYALQPGVWSPDGNFLVFVESNPKSDNDIWIYRKQDGKATPLLNADYGEDFPDLSPDGRWLAYCSDESGRAEVYATTFPSPSKKILISTDGGVVPLWSRDGRILYYWNIGRTTLLAVEITAAPTLAAGTPRKLFEFSTESISYIRPYDITIDGSRFIIAGRAERMPIEATRIMLVQNWFEELKRLVPAGKK
jgi:serine/threonine-protein kinase